VKVNDIFVWEKIKIKKITFDTCSNIGDGGGGGGGRRQKHVA
jgi:hypothetical protein